MSEYHWDCVFFTILLVLIGAMFVGAIMSNL